MGILWTIALFAVVSTVVSIRLECLWIKLGFFLPLTIELPTQVFLLGWPLLCWIAFLYYRRKISVSKLDESHGGSKDRPRELKWAVPLLVLALLVSSWLNIRSQTEIEAWKDEVRAQIGVVASEQAMEDFRKGRLRLLKLEGHNDDTRFSGKHEGPFEIWILYFYPELGAVHKYSQEQYVEFYNRKMKYMHAFPEQFTSKPSALPPNQKRSGQSSTKAKYSS